MSQRKVLKDIIQFGKREFKEKKPLSVEILRVKSKTILTRGVLPSLSVKQVKGSKYLVVADYQEFFRIYPFTSSGVLLGGQNLEKTAKLLKILKKGTVKEYTLPKELPKLTIGDISAHYQKQFNKAQKSLNDAFGLNINYPLSIIATKNLNEVNKRELCVQRNKTFLKIDVKYWKTPTFEVIIHRELIYYFLKRMGIFPKNKDLIYDFCYFLTAIFLRGEKAEQIFELWETVLPVWNINDYELNLMENKDQILKLINETYTENELKIFIGNAFSTLDILNKYKILINSVEFLSLFKYFYHRFQKLNTTIIFEKAKLKEIIVILRDLFFSALYQKYFYPQDFENLLKIKENTNQFKNFLKLTHLTIIFSVLGGEFHYIRELKSKYSVLKQEESLEMLFGLPEYKLSSAIRYFSDKTNISNNISNFQKLLQDMFKSYIFNYCLEINYDSAFFCDTKPNETKILHIEVFNHSDIVLKDTTLNSVMNPKNRMDLKILKDSNYEDLDKKLEWEYELTGKIEGKVNFSIQLVIKDPFIESNIFKYKKKLGVIIIRDK